MKRRLRNRAAPRRAAPTALRRRAGPRRSELLAEVQQLREELAAERQMKEGDLETLRELEISRGHYADLYDFAPVGFASLDRSGVVRDINLTGAQLLGRERGGLVGLPVLPLVAKEDRPKWLKHLIKVRSEPQA